MGLVNNLVTICCIATLATAQLNYENPSYVPDYQQTQSSYAVVQQLPKEDTQVSDGFLSSEFLPPRPDAPRPFFVQNPSDILLPKPEAPKPFFLEEPSEELKAPTKEASVFTYDQEAYPPQPAEELQLPGLEKWNPSNDPTFYYPATDVPTKLYPKKYNKDLNKVSLKTKPLLTDEDLAEKQRLVDKVLFSLAKQENKKRLEKEKKRQEEQQEQESRESFEEKVVEPQASESGFVGSSSAFTGNSLQHGLSHDGQRMEFQVHGHDGPKSYKWGFDTGKGHNRQFRYEEKDKEGVVKGHYGYYDKHGKLRLINYDSHPHEGFHAHEADVGEHH